MKSTLILSITLFLFSNPVFSQQNWAIGVEGISQFGWPTESYDIVKGKPTYGVRILGSYSLTKKLSLNAGLAYRSFKTITKNIPDTRDLFNPDGTINPDPARFDFIGTTTVIRFPLIADYIFYQKDRFFIFASAGLEPGFFHRGKSVLQYNDGRIEKYRFGRKDLKATRDNFNSLGIIAAFGFAQHLTDNLWLVVKPEYGYTFDIDKFHHVGLGMELKWFFKRELE